MKFGQDLMGFNRFRRIPMKSASESGRWESDKNLVRSNRFFLKDVGLWQNPTRIRSDSIGSTGRIESLVVVEKTNRT